MKFRTKIVFRRSTITVSGVSAIVLLLGILVLPYLWDGSLEPEEAEEAIRLYLLGEVAEQYLVEREDGSTGILNREVGLRYEEEVDRVNNLEFVSVEVRRTIIPPHLRRSTHFVVKAVIRDQEQHTETRYFWFNGPIVVRETSKLHWHIPI
jgi:hypothetical protein